MSIWRKRHSHSTKYFKSCSHKSEVYFHFTNTFRILVVRLCNKFKTENYNSCVISNSIYFDYKQYSTAANMTSVYI